MTWLLNTSQWGQLFSITNQIRYVGMSLTYKHMHCKLTHCTDCMKMAIIGATITYLTRFSRNFPSFIFWLVRRCVDVRTTWRQTSTTPIAIPIRDSTPYLVLCTTLSPPLYPHPPPDIPLRGGLSSPLLPTSFSSLVFSLVTSLCEARNMTTSPFSFLMGTMSNKHQNGTPELQK